MLYFSKHFISSQGEVDMDFLTVWGSGCLAHLGSSEKETVTYVNIGMNIITNDFF